MRSAVPVRSKWRASKAKTKEYSTLLALADAAYEEISSVREGRGTVSYSTASATLSALGRVNDRFVGYGQQDSHEALVTILDAFHEATQQQDRQEKHPTEHPGASSSTSPDGFRRRGRFSAPDENGSESDSSDGERDKEDDYYNNKGNEDDEEESEGELSFSRRRLKRSATALSASVRSLHHMQSDDAWSEYVETARSVVSDSVMGLVATGVFCLGCHELRLTHHPFSVLSLNFPEQSGTSSRTSFMSYSYSYASHTVFDCLQNFSTINDVSGVHCDKCKCNQKAKHFLFVSHWPPVLILHFNRFIPGAYFFRKDSSTLVIPQTISPSDLAEIRNNHKFSSYTTFPLPRNEYILTAAVNHSGSMAGGHYTCTARTEDDRWRNHSDSMTSSSSIPSRSSEAYLLMYSMKL